MRIRALCGLLLLALLLGLCPGATAAGGSEIIFLALNDAMPYALSAETMPYWSGGVLYVHSSTFNITSLNLSASYNAGNMTLLLYSGATRRSLTFYLSDGYVQTQTGATAEVTAAMRGEQVFLPLDYCAGFFGIGVSYLTSLQGWPLVRLTTGAQVWEDAFFVEQADKLINERAEKYLDAATPTTPTTPDTPSTNPSTDPSPNTPTDPVVTVDPTDEPEDPDAAPDGDPDEDPEDDPEEDAAPLQVYLALVGIEAVQATWEQLAAQSLPAAVYLTAQEILDNADLVRQLYAAGYALGVTGDLAAANDALDLVLCRRSLLTLDTADDGYYCHHSTHTALPEEPTEEPILLRLEGETAGELLAALLAEPVVCLPLRETTALFLTPPATPAIAQEST